LRIKPETELAVISILSVLLIIIIAFLPSNVLRIILGLPFILFFPGYTLVAALFPKKADLGGIERIALSLGLSIAVVPLVGLVLNYTPWGIELYPILVSITMVILATSGVAWYRRHRSSEEERFSISFNINPSQWTTMRGWDKVLSIILVASILGAVGTIAYVIVTPKTGEKFTEFYVLGLDGEAANYPNELTVGEEGQVILGIVNHEHEDNITYRVEILVDGKDNGTTGPLALDHDEKWENEVGFVLQGVGDNQKVEFILYKNGEEEPYSSLHLWIDVKNTS